jgi:tripartite ATP-independent transporter DctM subunit
MASTSDHPSEASSPEAAGFLRPLDLFGRLEGWILAALFTGMATLPVLEFLFRRFMKEGVPDTSSWVQHFVLLLAMAGGAVAAREGRLLNLATGAALEKSRFRLPAHILSNGVAVGLTFFLGVAGYQFAMSEREAGTTLGNGVSTWFFLLAIPVGFLLVAWRILKRTSPRWKHRLLALGVAVSLSALALVLTPAQGWVVAAFALLFLATLLGAPIFIVLGGSALILFWGAEVTITTIPIEMYRLVMNPTLPTIPLFTLAGYFLAEGGASKRLVRVFQAWFGWMPGGPAIVTALVCAFFTSFTGASGVTILALGGLLLPVLLSQNFSEKNSLGLLTAAGSLGLLFPPALPVIIYGVVSHTPIDKLFLGGLVPGFLLVGLVAWWGILKGRHAGARHPFNVDEARKALWEAKWEIALPFVVLAGMFSGYLTLVQAATLTALYAFVVETFLYKDLSISEGIPKVMTECGILVGGVLLILTVALGFTSYLVDAEVPSRLVEWVRASISSPLVFLLLVNVFLLIVGCLMDIFSAIVVVVPILTPMAAAFGIDPVHFGILFLANMELGYLTPPVGMNLFLSSYRFNKPMSEVIRATLPMLLILLLGVLLITYIPFLTTFLPTHIGR